jgi:hypothetical protein
VAGNFKELEVFQGILNWAKEDLTTEEVKIVFRQRYLVKINL